jgi:hypothetical protein
MQWETEITLYGPITEKLGFMFSGRYREGVPVFPTGLKYNPDMTFQGALTYQLSSKTKLELNGIYTRFENTGTPRTNWGSIEDTHHDGTVLSYVTSPYHIYNWWFWGGHSASTSNIRPPEKAEMLNIQAKMTHVFNPKSFLVVSLGHTETEFRMDFLDIVRSYFYGSDGKPQPPDPATIPRAFFNFRWDRPGDLYRNWVDTKSNTIKADFTSQLNNHHQMKTGILFSLQKFKKILHDHQSSGSLQFAQVTDLVDPTVNPYEGAFYLQDKMEFQGMVVNAGVRIDFFNGNKTISNNVFDPLLIGDLTEGHEGPIGHISYDPDGSGPGYTKTPFRIAVSPRLGLSHVISENTVLHFMFGRFNQRPPWNKIVGPPVARTLPPEEGVNSNWNLDPEAQLVFYNFYTSYTGNPWGG